MKKLFGFATAFLLSFTLQAVPLKEGVHYEVINEQATAKPEVKEFFSYYCPHCYSFEPLADKFKDSAKKNGFEFKKSHVDFLRAAGPEIQAMLTRALVAAERLDAPQASTAIFKYIHKQRAVFTKEKDIRNLFVLNGVDGDKFDKAFNSFAVKAAARKMKKEQDELSRRGVLRSVPTFIVNGKYKINSQAFKAKTYDELFSQIEAAALELVKKS